MTFLDKDSRVIEALKEKGEYHDYGGFGRTDRAENYNPGMKHMRQMIVIPVWRESWMRM